MKGVYRLTNTLIMRGGGRPDAWITYRSYDGKVLITPRTSMRAALIQVRAPAAYLEFRGLTFDGGGTNAYEAYQIEYHTHHVRVLNNVISNMSAAGIAVTTADYVTFTGNRIYRFGDGVGWSSGISFNSGDGAFWFDNAAGFHSVIADNIVTGGIDNSDHHSDGNGIIADLGGNIPPVLIADNLVYENGGRCIHSLGVQHVWVINNTCYMNGLDSRLGTTGEITSFNSQDIHLINNVAVAWTGRRPYAIEGGSSVALDHNVGFDGIASAVPGDVSADPSRLLTRDPGFAAPIAVDPAADGQWKSALPPSAVGERFRPQPSSVLRRWGVDPRAQPGVTKDLLPTLETVLGRDLAGQRRWLGGRFSVGAYDS
ncbi:MAG: hypothetical protein E6G60_03865 [Actinobacteria bacterium]|nr:MAG: hypothetical protein E6G60_03865 [Actinomycetota bacterium]